MEPRGPGLHGGGGGGADAYPGGMIRSPYRLDAFEGGEADAAHGVEELGHVGGGGFSAGGGGVEIGEEAGFPDGAGGDVVLFEIGLDRPAGHGGDGAVAGDELQDGDGEFGLPPWRLDPGGEQHFADDIDAVIGNRVGDQGFLREVLCGEVFLPGEGMIAGEERQHFVAEEGVEGDAGAGLGLGDDHEIRDVFRKKADGVGLEA